MLKSAVHSKESLLVALLLAMNTGFVDAFTFFHFDGRFASLQTGNLIQTGINLAHGNLEKAFQFIIPILFFALGALFKTLFTKYKTQNNQSEIESLHTGSTGQTELPKERVKALELHLPDNGTLDRFSTLIAPMAAAIVSKQNENNKLATLRDALLPKLMSGEIDVSAVQL